MSNSVHDSLDAVNNLTVGCFQLFLTGALYAMAVFNEAVEQSAKVPGALDGVWSASMVWMSLSGTVAMLLAGVAMSERSTQGEDDILCDSVSKTHRVRLLSIFGSMSFLMMGLAAVGVLRSSAFFLRTAVVLQGIPFGILELLAAWMPTRPGLAVGAGQMCFGLGCAFFSSFFEYLLRNFRCSTAFLITAAALAAPSASCIGLLKWPSGPGPLQENVSENTLKDEHHLVIPWTKLPFLLPFWYYVASIFAGQVGYAFIPYFFKIGRSFGKSTDVLVNSFQVAILLSTISRPFVGMLSDSLKWGHGFFGMGSKNVLIILLILQLTAFVCLVSFSTFLGFVVCSCIVLVVFSGVAVESSILARDMFTPVNSSLVFGFGASIAMGFGEFGTGEIMAAVDNAPAFEVSGASKYHPFYMLSAALSVFGLLSCFMLQKHAPLCCSSEASEFLSGVQTCSTMEERERVIGKGGILKKSYSSMP